MRKPHWNAVLRAAWLPLALAAVALLAATSSAGAASVQNGRCRVYIGPRSGYPIQIHASFDFTVRDTSCEQAEMAVETMYIDGALSDMGNGSATALGWTCKSNDDVHFKCVGAGGRTDIRRMSFRWPGSIPQVKSCPKFSWLTGFPNGANMSNGTVNPDEPCVDLNGFFAAFEASPAGGYPAPPNGWNPLVNGSVGPDLYTAKFDFQPLDAAPVVTNEIPTGRYACTETFGEKTTVTSTSNGGTLSSLTFSDVWDCNRVQYNGKSIVRDETVSWSDSMDQPDQSGW